MLFKVLVNSTLESNILLLGLPKKYQKYILRAAYFYIDNKRIQLDDIVNVNDIVKIEENEESTIAANEIAIKIVYEDDYILVVDKPSNIAMSPTHAHPSGTLANGIIHHYQTIGIKQTVHYITRLDYGTSGIVLIAKTKWSKHLMQMRRYDIERIYYARVHGILLNSGSIEQPIMKSVGIKRVVDPSGQYALTHYEVCSHLNNTTLVRCQLQTGRTHQIRVHLNYLGHPIVNDNLYSDCVTQGCMQLVCYTNRFVHPISQELMIFESEYNLI